MTKFENRVYEPDDLELINKEFDTHTYNENSELDLSSEVNNYIYSLKRTDKNKMPLPPDERLKIIEVLLYSNNSRVLNHFVRLTDTLISKKEYMSMKKIVETPLETLGSFLMATSNNDIFLKRKFVDGQQRKKTDGTTSARKFNISLESDLTTTDENGHQTSPIQQASIYDTYAFDFEDTLSDFAIRANLTVSDQ